MFAIPKSILCKQHYIFENREKSVLNVRIFIVSCVRSSVSVILPEASDLTGSPIYLCIVDCLKAVDRLYS